MLKDQKDRDIATTCFDGNVLVSAGAGCGKTRVLTTRIFNIIKSEFKTNPNIVSQLLVLTFTNKAAAEMKFRTRAAIASNPDTAFLGSEVEAADICTFDAFALALVQKYHHELNIRGEIQIGDEMVLKAQEYKIITQVLENYYKEGLIDPNSSFNKMVKRYCIDKDDCLRDYIVDLLDFCDKSTQGLSFLDTAIDTYFSKDFADNYLKRVFDYCSNKIRTFDEALSFYDDENDMYNNDLKLVDGFKSLKNLKELINYLVSNKTYFSQHKCQKTESDGNKKGRSIIKSAIDDFKELIDSESYDDIVNSYYSLKEFVQILCKVAKDAGIELEAFKKKYAVFTFNDIFKLAFNLVENNLTIRNEISNKYKYILIDEYQDTNDVQEAFINLISKNNVFQVGDIKQAIYGFRGGNCDLFDQKCKKYEKNEGGTLLRLTENFRTRTTVLDFFNDMFSKVMVDNLGGCTYAPSHCLGHGQTNFDATENEEDRNTEVYVYEHNEELESAQEEATIIANDIINKVNNHYKITDETFNSKECSFGDFAILLAKKADFVIYQKVFNMMGIPLDCKDMTSFEDQDSINVLLNICRLICEFTKEENEKKRKLYFASIFKSFLCCGSDEELYELLNSGDYKEVDFYKGLYENYKFLLSENIVDAIKWILDSFDFYNRFTILGDIKINYERMNLVLSRAKTGSLFAWNLQDFIQFYDDLKFFEIKMETIDEPKDPNSVNLMTIHSSKGLEWPIVYMAQLDNELNDKQEKWQINKEAGFLMPNESNEKTIFHNFNKVLHNKEIVSEKIRLLYVGATRAREKLIFVVDQAKEKVKESVAEAKNYSEVLATVQVAGSNDILKATKETDDRAASNKKENGKLEFAALENIPVPVIKNPKKASKDINIFTNQEALLYGTRLHRLLELTDFKTEDVSWIKNPKDREIISGVLSNHIFDNSSSAKVFHEYSFEDEESKLDGVIDLLLVYKDHIDIVDYKTSNIDDPLYESQLSTYATYVEKIFKLPTKKYLLSIKEGKVKEV